MKIVSEHSFWSPHYNQIKEEGWTAIRRKLFSLMRRIGVTIPLTFLAIPVVLIVRIIRPLIWIRFGGVRSDVIGNSVFNAEYYLSERALNQSNTLDLFYFQFPIFPNEQWALMIRRHLRIHPLVRYLENANSLIPCGQNHCVNMMPPGRTGDIKGVLSMTRPQTPFTEEEDRKGQKFLEEIGVKQGERFICLLVRDSYYKSKEQRFIKKDWSYHNFRDLDIDTFKNTALKLAEEGYWVLRMGKIVQKTFHVDHLRVQDYANSSYRSDFLDIWLMANCHFCITTGTGLDDVCVAFRR
nr:TIGR04372 family glycosyltransferase [Bacteroidota bacterium]